MDLEKLSNLFGADLVKKVYEDGASEGTKELGKVTTDLIKTLRLFTAPIQLLAAYQDRLAKHLEKVRNNVKPENQIEAPASIAGPILDKLKYLEDTNYLTDLYLNLLTRAIDKERINEAHPAFFHIIDQLAPDEAMILYLLSKGKFNYNYDTPIVYENEKFKHWGVREIKKDNRPLKQMDFEKNFDMYIEHLKSLNLAYWIKNNEKAILDGNVQTHTSVETEIGLTEFGKMFVNACIPKDGFVIVNEDV